MTLYNHYTKAAELIIQTLTNMKELPPDLPELVHEGPLFKRSRNSWKERWFVLFSNHQMLYYLDQNESNKATNLCGWIDLHDVWMVNSTSTETSITNLIPSFMKPSITTNNKLKNKRKSLEISRKNKNNKNKYKQQHELTLITSTQTIQLKSNHAESFLKWILYLDKFVFDNQASIIYQGWLWKKSLRKRRQWKKRWVVIENYTKAITYYENETRSNFRHFIALADIVDDINTVKPHKSFQYGFTMTTLERNYTFATTDKNDMNKWLQLIKKARREVLVEIAEDENNNDSSSSSMDEYAQDLHSSDTDSDSDTHARYPILAITDLVLHKNSASPSVEKIDIQTMQTSDVQSDELQFDFDPNQLQWLKEHDMLHTGHLSARKNRSLHGEDMQAWQPPTHNINMEMKEKDNANFNVRPWSPWSTSTVTSVMSGKPGPPTTTSKCKSKSGNDIHMFKVQGRDKYANKILPKPPPRKVPKPPPRNFGHKNKYTKTLGVVEEHVQMDIKSKRINPKNSNINNKIEGKSELKTKIEIDQSKNISVNSDKSLKKSEIKMNQQHIISTKKAESEIDTSKNIKVKNVNNGENAGKCKMKTNQQKQITVEGREIGSDNSKNIKLKKINHGKSPKKSKMKTNQVKKLKGRSNSITPKKKDKYAFKVVGVSGKKEKKMKEHKRSNSINSIKKQSKSTFKAPKAVYVDIKYKPNKPNKRANSITPKKKNKSTFKTPNINAKRTSLPSIKPKRNKNLINTKVGKKITPKKKPLGPLPKPIHKKKGSKIGATSKKNRDNNSTKPIYKKRDSKIRLKPKKIKDKNATISKKKPSKISPKPMEKTPPKNKDNSTEAIHKKLDKNNVISKEKIKPKTPKKQELKIKHKKQKTVKFDVKTIEKEDEKKSETNINVKKRHRKTGSRNSRIAHRRQASRRKRSKKSTDEKESGSDLPPLEYISEWKCASCYFLNRSIFINDRGFAKWRDNCLLCGRKKREFNSLSNLSKTHLINAENNALDNKLLAEWKGINILNQNNFNHQRGGSSSYSSSSSLSFTSQTLCKSHYIDCMSVKRLIFIMKYFNEFSLKIMFNSRYNENELTLTDFFEYLPDYDISDLYFDLYHCLQLHWNKFLISLFKSKVVLCGGETKCIHFQRNYRERSKCKNNNYRFKLYLISDNNEIAMIQILDSIHCMMFHDLSMNIVDKYREQKLEQSTHINNDFKLEIMRNRRQMLSAHHLNKLLMDNCDLKKISKKSKYLLKSKPKNNILGDDFEPTNNEKYKWATRTAMEYLDLKPNHPNLFTELTCNPLNPLSIEQWNTEVRKAKYYCAVHPMVNNLQSNGSKKHLQEWGLKYSQPLGMEHIIVIMIYCNYTQFNTYFRKLHRKLREEDTNEIISNRHSQIFYWFGRFLIESVSFYGNTMSDNILLYHASTCNILFNYFDAQYKYPSMTTLNSLIAQTFVGENGIILELCNKFNGYFNQTRYLNVMLISDFKDEHECLYFAQNCDNLLINDIITLHTNIYTSKIILNRHKKWLKCLNFFQQICSGNSTRNCFHLNDINENTIKLLKIMLENEINLNKGNNDHNKINKQVPHFIQSLFHYYCVTKKGESPYAKFDTCRKYIDIGCIQDEWFDIYSQYFDSQDKVLQIFTNIKQFRVMDIRTSMETPKFGYLSSAKFSNRSAKFSNRSSASNSYSQQQQVFFPVNI